MHFASEHRCQCAHEQSTADVWPVLCISFALEQHTAKRWQTDWEAATLYHHATITPGEEGKVIGGASRVQACVVMPNQSFQDNCYQQNCQDHFVGPE